MAPFFFFMLLALGGNFILMKKFPKFLLLSLASISLIGCNRGNVSTTTPADSSTQESTTPDGDSTDTTSSNTDTTTTSSEPISSDDTAISSTPVSSEEEEVSSSSSVDLYETTQWNRNTVDKMIVYLDSNIIPYVDLGKYTTEYNDSTSKSSSYLLISGGEFDSSKMDGFKDVYEKAGWNITKNLSTNITAEKDLLKVEIVKDSDGYFALKVYYDKPYDESTAPTDWDSDTITSMNDSLDNHVLPYVYLGANACYTSFSSYSKKLTIYGYQFNAAIINNAKKAFTDDGWTVTETTGSYGPGIIATKAFPDTAETITVTVDTPSSSSTTRYSIAAQLTETWDNTVATAWPSDMDKDITNTCDGHSLDYFYLGTKEPTYSYSSSYGYFTITGGYYDERTIPGVKSALSNSGWTVTDQQGTYGIGIAAVKTFDDGCEFKLLVNVPSSTTSKITATLYFLPKLTLPAEEKQVWPDDVKGLMDVQLNHHVIPYIFLGDEDVEASFSNSNAKMTVKTTQSGTFYTAKIIDNAKDVLVKDNWTVTSGTNSYGETIKATKTYDNGDVIIVSLDSVSVTSKAYLYIQLIEAYDPTYVGAWNTDRAYDNLTGDDTTSTQNSMDTNLHGHKVPYVYLGTKNHNCNWSDTNKTLTIYGGRWNTNIIKSAKESFDTDIDAEGNPSWTYTITATDEADLTTASKFVAIKTFDDGCTLTATIDQPSADTDTYPVHATTMTVAIRDAWGSKITAWPQNVLDNMTAIGIPANAFPYVYLGTDKPTTSKTSSAYQKYVQVLGTPFDDRVLNEFDTALTAAGGWTIEDDGIRFGKDSHVAYKYLTDETGAITGILRAGIYRYTNNDNGKAALRLFYDEFPKEDTIKTSVYTDENKKLMKDTLDGTDSSVLPSFHLGEKVDVTASASNGEYLQVQTATASKFCYNYAYVYYSMQDFIADNWTITKNKIFTATGDPTGQAGFSATKTTANGTLTVDVTSYATASSSYLTAKAYYFETFAKPTDTTTTWSTEISTAMKDSLDGYVLPYFYIGKKNPTFKASDVSTSSNKVLTLTGSTWDDSIAADMKAALAKDTKVTDWAVMEDYSNAASHGVNYIATGSYTYTIPATYDEDGETIITPEQTVTKHITLKLYRDTEANKLRPILEVYYF